MAVRVTSRDPQLKALVLNLFFWASLALASLLPSTAVALDVQVSNTTTTQVYEIRGGQPDLFLARRRVTERLTLQLTRLLPREEDEGYRGPRLSAVLLMRIDADFGHIRRETLPSSDMWYVPGYDPYDVDLMVAEIVVRDLLSRTTDIRAGRLISLDPTGFSALDGAELAVRLPWHVRLWLESGVEVVDGRRLSSGAFEVDGVLRVRRDDLLEDSHPEFSDPPTRIVFAGGVSLIDFDFVSAELAYRQGFIPGDDGRMSYQRLAGEVSLSLGPFEGGLVAAGDLAVGLFDELSLDLGVRPLRWLLIGLGGRYQAPVFDVDSIFAAFWSDPSLDLDLRLELRPLNGLRVGVIGRVRQAGFLEPDGGGFNVEGLGYGGDAYGRVLVGRFLGELRGRLGLGYGGRRVGVTGRFSALLPGNLVSLDFRGIVLGLRDDLPPNERTVNLGYVVGARYQMAHDAAVLFEFEHNGSQALGQQFRFLVLLDLGVWI